MSQKDTGSKWNLTPQGWNLEGVPAYQDQTRYTQVGRSVPRVDAPAKVKGEAVYTGDMTLPGMAYGKIKRSPYAHAILKKIDISKAQELPGVLAVLTGAEAPNRWGIVPQTANETVLALDKVRFYGEGVAAVAAIDEETAEEALDLIEVEYEPLPVLLDPFESMERAHEVLIHEDSPGNIMHQGEQVYGDVDKAFSECAYVLEREFHTNYPQHGFLEPHTALASYDPQSGQMHVWSSTQVPHYLHRQLSIVLEIPMNKIRVTLPTIGGGFGGKGEASSAEFAACLLSRKIGRPVRVTYERSEVFYTNKGRHPAHMKLKMGLDQDGYIKAVDFDNTMDKGAYSGWGVVVLFYTASMMHLPYKVPNVRFRGRSVYTNKPSTGAMRGLGGVQPRFAMECLLDELAEMMGVSPYELKMKNAIESGHTAVNNMFVPHSEYKKCLQTAVEKSGYLEKRGRLPFGKGIGMAGGYYISGTAYTLYQNYKPHTSVMIRVDTEAGVTLFCAAADIGQGSNTVMAQMAAEELGVFYEDVHVQAGDTEIGAFDLGSFASRLTYASGAAIKMACVEINQKLKETAAGMLGVRADQLVIKKREIYSMYETKKRLPWEKAVEAYTSINGSLVGLGNFSPPRRKGIDMISGNRVQGANIGHSPTYGFSCQVHEVEVDVETGRIYVKKVTEAGDCGTPVNPMSVEGQVEGSILFNIGGCLYEDQKLDASGKHLNPNFHDYKMPTMMEMPEMDTNIVESYDPTAPFGVKETGEGAVQPTFPALVNAIYDAIGVRFYSLPITPEMILKALKEKKEKEG
ncbi:xanthine dehydrogenase family protein molybdopterin-binding subunit [Paradesulfitobacterium ferrireducens]|uniref:xanthine dehydrogenase family protein molybdopterin-binding subunit n=1 Tax=Paradesulfitobacterium ferrireducens TaxID=2816476 RepID=UPI001A8FE7EB|nr:xanthine dehydrogenase family protein molybdopterin-binding subunit [Paradesulfitobacterium ferrireducens]